MSERKLNMSYLPKPDDCEQELADLKAKLAVMQQQLNCAITAIHYAEPALSIVCRLRDRFDAETQGHLQEALLQVRRSQNDIHKLAIIEETPSNSMELEINDE